MLKKMLAKKDKVEKISMRKVELLAERIRKLEIQAASSIAVQSLEALRPLVEKKGFGKEFEAACELLLKTRPTGISLYNALQLLKRERKVETLDKLLHFHEDAKRRIAQLAFGMIEKDFRILTHCHSTTVTAALIATVGKGIQVYVTETRPVLQGLITAREMIKLKIPVTYCVDSAIGYLFEHHDVDFCIVGADAIKPSGVINKLGTCPMAALADDNNVPFYVVTDTLKFDYDDKSVIEMRPATEIIRPVEILGAKILNPAFDLTPWKYITGVITEKGVLTRNQIVGKIKKGFSFE